MPFNLWPLLRALDLGCERILKDLKDLLLGISREDGILTVEAFELSVQLGNVLLFT